MQTFGKILWALIRQLTSWMLFFALMRAFFLLYNFRFISGLDAGEVMTAFLYALRLDLSTACYLLLIPLLLYAIQSVWNRSIWHYLHLAYTLLFLIVYAGISAGEMGVYGDWQIKLHFKALLYLKHPAEIAGTAETGTLFFLIAVWLLSAGGGFLLWLKVFYMRWREKKRNVMASILSFLIIVPAIFLGLRGGVQEIPVNQSSVYHSEHEILNIASVNNLWNLTHSVLESVIAMGHNPFVFYTGEHALEIKDRILHTPVDSTLMILDTLRPNVVLLILEGWSAEMLAGEGRDPRILPFVNSLDSQSVVFTDVYSSGTRSQQGICAILSAYPAIPYSTVTDHQEKYSKLPMLGKDMQKLGYTTSFYFGGQLSYGNMRSYLMSGGFQHIQEEKDVDPALKRGKLGVHDNDMMNYYLMELNTAQEPFFSALFTLSTHNPYDHEPYKLVSGYSTEADYVNAMHYADHCLQDFFDKASKQVWYANTLFVMISDHSHTTPSGINILDPDYNRIVFRLYGDVIKPEYRGMAIASTGSQVDLAATLLPQLGRPAGQYVWSKNLLNPAVPQYAYYSFEGVLGWVRPCAWYVYDFRYDKQVMLGSESGCATDTNRIREEGRAYLQLLYQDFLDM